MTRSLANSIGTALLPLLVAALSACCGGATNLRASDELAAANPMHRIAVITGGQVVSFTSEGQGIDLVWSRKALQAVNQRICDGLQEKGYTVTFCQTAGIGFRRTGAASLWFYDVDESGQRTLKADQEHVPLADPLLNEHAEIQGAVREVFAALEDASAGSGPSRPRLPQDDVLLLGKVLGADTLCVNRVYGEKRSKGAARRSRGATGQRSAQRSLIEPSLICVAAASGDVLWEYGATLDAVYAGSAGIAYPDRPLRTMLERFPAPGWAVDAGAGGAGSGCRRAEEAGRS